MYNCKGRFAENREGARKLLDRLHAAEIQWRDMNKLKSLDESAKVAYLDCAETIQDIAKLSAWLGKEPRE